MSGELSGGGESGGDLTTQGKGWDEGGRKKKRGEEGGGFSAHTVPHHFLI